MALTWEELDGSPIEEWNRDTGAFRAIQKFKVAWSDRLALADMFLRSGGMTYEHAPTFPGLHARSATTEPFGRQEGSTPNTARYADAIVTVTFATPAPDTPVIIGNVLTTVAIEPNAEFSTLDHTNFRWGSGSGAELNPNESPGKLNIGLDYVLTQQGLESVPFHVLSYPGSVNNAVFSSDILGLTFGIETLLYNPPTIAQGTQPGTWNVSYRFSYRKGGWNKFWRAESQTEENIFHTDGSIYNSYPTRDFSII